jgi:hypothetical protein
VPHLPTRRSTALAAATRPAVSGRAGPGTPAAACGGRVLQGIDRPGEGDGGRDVDQQVHTVCLAVDLAEFAADVRAYAPHDLLHPLHRAEAGQFTPVLVTKTKPKTQLCQRVYPGIRRYSRVS